MREDAHWLVWTDHAIRIFSMSASDIFPCTIKSTRRFLLVPACPGSLGKTAIKRLCVCVLMCLTSSGKFNYRFNRADGKRILTRMWANAQRDDCPAEYRWRPLFNAAKFGWRPLLECRAITLPICETCWNVLGCPKLANRSQLLVGRSSTYYEDMWGRHCWLTSFLSDYRYMP